MYVSRSWGDGYMDRTMLKLKREKRETWIPKQGEVQRRRERGVLSVGQRTGGIH